MKRRQLTFILALLLLMGAACFWLASSSRAATETPAYTVVRADGKLEIRDYPSLTVAGTSMAGDDMDGSFMRLFRFITGHNERSEKIAMTTPVLIDTAPGQRRMNFIMPAQTVEKGVPKPAAESVALRQIQAARFAVPRFPGGRNAENEAKALAQLKACLEAAQLTSEGSAVFAYYDPPWTPTFLRRNEVMVRIAAP